MGDELNYDQSHKVTTKNNKTQGLNNNSTKITFTTNYISISKRKTINSSIKKVRREVADILMRVARLLCKKKTFEQNQDYIQPKIDQLSLHICNWHKNLMRYLRREKLNQKNKELVLYEEKYGGKSHAVNQYFPTKYSSENTEANPKTKKEETPTTDGKTIDLNHNKFKVDHFEKLNVEFELKEYFYY